MSIATYFDNLNIVKFIIENNNEEIDENTKNNLLAIAKEIKNDEMIEYFKQLNLTGIYINKYIN